MREISRRSFNAAMHCDIQKIKISRSCTVASPIGEGDIFSHILPFLYSRGLKSGLVDREKRGYSIDAVSDFGAASKISQTKKSSCGCLSGRRGGRTESFFKAGIPSFRHIIQLDRRFGTSPTQYSVLHPQLQVIRYFTHRASPLILWITDSSIRYFTHGLSVLHT